MHDHPVRLQKFLAEGGVASRRAAETLILAGRVRVNGQIVRQLGRKIHPEQDRVELEGQRVECKPKLHVALHKPRGYLCTRHDPEGRKTVFQLLPPEWGHLYPIGRLDRDSEGLLLLTNDGALALRLTHPRYGCGKTYRVAVAGKVDRALLDCLERGVKDRGEWLRAVRAHLLEASPDRTVVEVELREGRNREIRRMFEQHGFKVRRLQRTRIGRISLRGLRVGQWRALTEPEISSLLQTL